MAVIPPLIGFWQASGTLFVTPEAAEFTVSAFIPSTDPPPGDDELPAGTYNLQIQGSRAVFGSAPRGFTIFRYMGNLETDDSGNSTAIFVQAGSTAVYVDGTDYDSSLNPYDVLVDISATINNAGQVGTWMIVPWDTGSGREYSSIGTTYYSGLNGAVNSATPVESVLLVEAQIGALEPFADFDGNTVPLTGGATSAITFVVTEAGGTCEMEIFG